MNSTSPGTTGPMKTLTFYPSYLWAYILLTFALVFLSMWIGLVVLGLTPQSAEFPEAGSMGPAIVLGMILVPAIVLFFDISIGLFRSRVKLTEQGLDLTTTRFAIWNLRRVHRAQLTWDEVWGVQVWGQTNPMASMTDKTQIDYIIHTALGKYAIACKECSRLLSGSSLLAGDPHFVEQVLGFVINFDKRSLSASDRGSPRLFRPGRSSARRITRFFGF